MIQKYSTQRDIMLLEGSLLAIGSGCTALLLIKQLLNQLSRRDKDYWIWIEQPSLKSFLIDLETTLNEPQPMSLQLVDADMQSSGV